jgi:heme/copper-type cytochrome/quinol oxidase subunit 3
MSEITAHSQDAHGGHSPAAHNENLKFSMWLFLASEVILFTVLIATYVVYSLEHRDIVHEIHESTINILGFEVKSVLLVAANTFLLLTSSWAMVMGLRAIQMGDRAGLKRWLTYTAVLGAIFVLMQYVEYSVLATKGVTLYASGPESEFGMRFYAPTALHGAHVIAGVLWCLWVIRRADTGTYEKNPIGVEIFGLYWHFVDVVWIIIFTVIYLI